MTWTAPRTWVAGETVTAAQMNAHVRDNLLDLSAWQAYTPTWRSTGTQPSIGNGTLTGRYARLGGTVVLYLDLTFGSTTSFGSGAYSWDLPLTVSSRTHPTALGGWLYAEDLAVTGFYFLPRGTSGGTSRFELVYDDAAVYGGLFSTVQRTLPVTWSNGDFIRGHVVYETSVAHS